MLRLQLLRFLSYLGIINKRRNLPLPLQPCDKYNNVNCWITKRRTYPYILFSREVWWNAKRYSSHKRVVARSTAWEVSKYGVFSRPYFPAFGLNTEWYRVRTKKNSVFGHFSCKKHSLNQDSADNESTAFKIMDEKFLRHCEHCENWRISVLEM